MKPPSPRPQNRNHHTHNKLTSFFKEARSFSAPILSSPYNRPHSVNSSPGNTALTLTFGPWVVAKHFIKCSCAALVTEYGILEPLGRIPAIDDVMMKAPPSVLALKVGKAAARRWVCARTFTAQQVSQSAAVGAERSLKVLKRV